MYLMEYKTINVFKKLNKVDIKKFKVVKLTIYLEKKFCVNVPL